MALYPSTVQSLIPAIWATDLQVAYRKALVYGECANRKYQGLIKNMGDTVKINTFADVTLDSSYTRDTVITGQSVQSTNTTLAITQSNSFNVKWDEVNQAQSAVKDGLSEIMSRTAYQMADAVDQFVADTAQDGVATAAPDNVLTAVTNVGVGPTDTDPYDLLVDLNVLLSQSNVPKEGRWAVLPPWYMGELAKTPARVSFGTADNLKIWSDGYFGIDRASGLKLYVSNNVPTTNASPTVGAFTVIAGHSDGLTLAQQLVKYKSAEQPDGFYSNNLGVQLYGALVTRPYALASVDCTKSS